MDMTNLGKMKKTTVQIKWKLLPSELNSLALVSPETRETPPDTPAVPPLAVLSARDPEDVATERPEVNEMEPPVAVAASPPVNLE